MKKKYPQFVLSVFEEHYDLMAASLWDYPIIGVEEGLDRLTVSFDYTVEFSEAKTIIEHCCSLQPFKVAVVKEIEIIEENWNKQWEESLEPVVVSERIIIAPSWRKNTVNAPIVLSITPKMSFGTGYHATTRMMCQLLEKYCQIGYTVIDVGTGTGVLAILAAKLGAASVFAFDNDSWSVENADENVIENDVSECVRVSKEDIETAILPQARLIVANLYRNLLIPAFPKLYNAIIDENGLLIISGLLVFDIEEIYLAANQEKRFIHIETITEGDWAAIVFSKNSTIS